MEKKIVTCSRFTAGRHYGNSNNNSRALHSTYVPGTALSILYPSVLQQPYFFFNKFIYLFIYFWLCWVFVAVRGLSLVAVSGSYSSLQCMGFSLQWLLLLQSTGSRHTGFSSCGTRA